MTAVAHGVSKPRTAAQFVGTAHPQCANFPRARRAAMLQRAEPEVNPSPCILPGQRP